MASLGQPLLEPGGCGFVPKEDCGAFNSDVDFRFISASSLCLGCVMVKDRIGTNFPG
jgi:hypothetical protein